MSLTIQLNLSTTTDFNSYTELDTPAADTPVTKSVDAQGVVVINAASTEAFGAFDPGSVLGSRSADFVLQSMQVSSTGAGTGDVALIGPKPPGDAGNPHRFVFHTLASKDSMFTGGQIIPAGYKLSFSSSADGPHVIRLTLWPISRLEQISAILAV